MPRSAALRRGRAHQPHLRQRQRQVLPLLLPRARGHHGQPAGVQLGEPAQGDCAPLPQPGLEGGQGLQGDPVRVQGGVRAADGRHGHGLSLPRRHGRGAGGGAGQGGRVNAQGKAIRYFSMFCIKYFLAGGAVCAVEPVGALQEEQERRVLGPGQPRLPGAAAAEQVHRRGGERGRHPQEHLLLHRHLSSGGGIQVGGTKLNLEAVSFK